MLSSFDSVDTRLYWLVLTIIILVAGDLTFRTNVSPPLRTLMPFSSGTIGTNAERICRFAFDFLNHPRIGLIVAFFSYVCMASSMKFCNPSQVPSISIPGCCADADPSIFSNSRDASCNFLSHFRLVLAWKFGPPAVSAYFWIELDIHLQKRGSLPRTGLSIISCLLS